MPVDIAYNGEEAFSYPRPTRHDLILLDLMLPKIDGLSICRARKAKVSKFR